MYCVIIHESDFKLVACLYLMAVSATLALAGIFYCPHRMTVFWWRAEAADNGA